MRRFVLGAKIPVSQQYQSFLFLKGLGLIFKQPADSIVFEVFHGTEDFAAAIKTRSGHHQGSIPGDPVSKLVRVAQQQRPRPPSRLAEAQQQTTAGLQFDRIALVHKGDHDFKKMTLLPDLLRRRVIRVPG